MHSPLTRPHRYKLQVTTLMLFGSHVSAAGNLANAPANAASIGCEVFQFFSRPPQGGKAKPITTAVAAAFTAAIKQYNQQECYIHCPYFINLASRESRIRYGSVSVIREELERGNLLGVRYAMTHLGSWREVGEAKGKELVVEGLQKILDGYTGSTQFLIEIAAGAGGTIGSNFEDIAWLIERAEGQGKGKIKPGSIGVCFDTQHAFASGYDLRDVAAVKKTFDRFDQVIGLERLKMSHCNDSLVEFGSHRDRHEHLGRGKIGAEGFRAIVQEPRLKNVNLILETPKDKLEEDIPNLKLLKSFRGS